jgi:hypothetical protein
MTDILPFGSNTASGVPNLGVQNFLGLTVVDFSCNSSWDSQGGQCSIKLIQDSVENQYLQNAVIGSPQFFEIKDLDDTPIFRFYGILQQLTRSVDSSSKTYSAVLQSPTVLLESCGTVLEGFAGYGGAMEAYGPNVLSCLDFGSNGKNISPNNIFNIQNIFGVYENDVYGSGNAGFGRSAITSEGMRVDYFASGLNELVNGNTDFTPKLGGNILYGSDVYGSGSPYYYNFDIVGLIDQLSTYIPSDYRVQSENLMDFVSEICEETNHVFYVDLLKPSGSGLAEFGSGHVTTLVPQQTYADTIYGGQISVITQDRNTIPSGSTFPLSNYIINKEISNIGGSGQIYELPLDISVTGSVHPDGPPIGTTFNAGSYPHETISVDNFDRLRSSNVSVRLNDSAVGAKYVVGGFQSRVNYIKTISAESNASSPGPIPGEEGTTCGASGSDSDTTQDVYSYWGEINVQARNQVSPGNPFQKNVPVLTPIISEFARINGDNNLTSRLPYRDCIMIDLIDIMGTFTSTSAIATPPLVEDGIYAASFAEMKAASHSYEEWHKFLSMTKPVKLERFEEIFDDIMQTSIRKFRTSGGLTYLGRSVASNASHFIGLYNTQAKNIDEKVDTGSINAASYYGAVAYGKLIAIKLKEIYDEHYGKSYVVKVPAYTTKINPDYFPTSVDAYSIPSWKMSSDAFLDPSLFSEYDAPQGTFVNNARIKPYVNFETNIDGYRYIHDGQVLDNYTNPFKVLSNVNTMKNFANYSNDIYINTVSDYPVSGIVSVPASIDDNYMVLPAAYFTSYYPSTMFSDLAIDPDVDSEITSVRSFLLGLVLTDVTEGIPFAVVRLNSVVNDSSLDFADKEYDILFNPIAETGMANFNKSISSTEQVEKNKNAPIAHPIGFGIPQESTRYVYGPWVTQTTLGQGMKIEYVKMDELVPENYFSYSLMSQVGQLRANSVANFDYLYTEEGSIELPGLPQVTHLGQSLVENGPLVSDISVNISYNDITTKYSMNTYAPKFGKTSKYLADKITKMTSKLKK